MKNRILITGASGCVGQYIIAWLIKNSEAELFLWLRDPEKLTAIDRNNPRIKLLIGDLREAHKFSEELATVTRVIHTATAWGDPKRAYQVNVVAIKELLSLLNPNVVEQIIYFSTASILNKSLKPIPEAFSYGTEYIQTKAECLMQLENHPLAKKIIAVFPTLVFGGRIDNKSNFPTSYLTQGLREAVRWLWLARWFRAYSRFHFIHAADIASICGHLATSPHDLKQKNEQPVVRRFVLAQPLLTIDEAIDSLLEWKGIAKTPKLPLWNWLVGALIKILPIQVSSWDRFSIKKRHFDHYPITNPDQFGLHSHAKTIKEIISDSGLQP